MKPHTPVLLAGAAALALTATVTPAVASGSSDRHEITFQLPGGGTERIEYTGEAPQVVFSPVPLASPWAGPDDFWVPSSFASLERMSAEMDALFKTEMATFSSPPPLSDAALSNLPAGTTGTTWFTTSFGSGFCTQVTQISKPAAGGQAQIVKRESGDCGAKSATPSQDPASATHDGSLIATGLKAHKFEGSKPAAL